MRKRWILGVVGALALSLAGCGGGDTVALPPVVTIDIPSSGGVNDGDITYDPVLNNYTLFTNAETDNVYVGTYPNPLDPTNPLSDTDSRGFLTFPLSQIPAGAIIQNAQMLIRINDVAVLSGSSVIIQPAWVSFNPLNTLTEPQLINLFQDAVILVSPVTYNISPGNIGSDVSIDVTDPLVSARQRGFSTLQIKLVGSFGRIIVDDLNLYPILLVDYVF
jgi:hypothetical protein